VSRQRLRPSLNESYDIEHVLVRGPRSIGQSILRIIGEDAAKDNTGEIHVYVPADVASYLLNEKRYEIINIEKTSNIKVLVIADPYKTRPYYKVVRVKAADVKGINSYQLTPESPKPDTNWRDDNNKQKGVKPLVDGVKPPKMPKRNKASLIKWLKSITGIDNEVPKPKKKPINRTKKRNTQTKNNKKFNVKKKYSNKKNHNRSKPDNKTDKKTIKKKPISKDSINKLNTKESVNKDQKANKPENPSKKTSPIKEIVKEKKIKKAVPMRAKNDPRQKN